MEAIEDDKDARISCKCTMSIGTEGGRVNVSLHSCNISCVGNLEESALPLDSFQTEADVQLLLINSRFLQLLA